MRLLFKENEVNHDDGGLNDILAIHRIPKSHLVKEEWIPVVPKVHSNYLRIEANNPKMSVNEPIPFHQRLPFWDDIFGTGNKDEL